MPNRVGMQAVSDTNVVLWELLWPGPPRRLLEHVRALTLTVVYSPVLFAELRAVVFRPKFADILRRSHTDPDEMLDSTRQLVEFVDPPPLPAGLSRDPDDDAVLALAIAASVNLIVSGDSDLRVLGSHGGIPILTPAEALVMIEAGRNGAIEAVR